MRGRTAFTAIALLLGAHAATAQELTGAGAAPRATRAETAQELTLADALRRADAGAYGNRMAASQARAQAADGMQALQGILPGLRIEAGYTRTTDPIGAFGTTLRQRAITQNDFDPARLNYPGATPNYGAALILEQPLLNLDAHIGRRAAARATEAAGESAEWTRIATGIDVVRVYFGAVLMQERIATLQAALHAANAHVRQAESMKQHGLVTKSDALLARVHAGELETQLLDAAGEASLSKRRLAMLLGDPADTAFTLPAALPAAAAITALDALGWSGSQEARSDVRAARAGAAAARLDVKRSQSLLLPRLNAMARYDWNSASAPFGGDENWSIGVMATWSPFTGASQLADMRGASARAAAAAAQEEAALAQAELGLAAAANAWSVALARLRIAGDAVGQSEEAHRIVARRYEGELAAVVELLAASAAETEARLRFAHARYQAIVAAAERLQQLGREPAELSAALRTN